MGRLVASAKLNEVKPQEWLTDVLERMISGRIKVDQRLLPFTWRAEP